jgi:hypothetical protein
MITHKRTLVKTGILRILMFIMNFLVLTLMPGSSALVASAMMNAIAFGIYYAYDRLWIKIKWGRKIINE